MWAWHMALPVPPLVLFRGRAALFRKLHTGDLIILFKRLISASATFAGDAKGCGFDLNELSASLDDNKFCLAV